MRERLRRFKDRFPFGAIAIEVFSIVLAVLLALGVNEWREARSHRQLVRTALTNIRKEVLYNQPRMQERYPYHQRMRDSMRANASDIRGNVFSETASSKLGMGDYGMMFTNPTSFAWQAASTSQATAHMDYDMLELVGAIYGLQGSLLDLQDKLGSVMLNSTALQKENIGTTIRISSALMSDLVNVERQLLDAYDEFLARTADLETPQEQTGVDTANAVTPAAP